MTKLTTEITIEELQYRIHAHENDLTQMWTADYFLNVQKELLALKQAAKNPVAWTDSDELKDAKNGGSAYLFSLDGGANKFADPRRKIMLYTAPAAQPVIPRELSSFVTDADIAALHRFVECCDDPESGGHDLEKEQVQRLEKIGALQRSGRISYITDFGDYLISVAPAQESE
jgi:hypothetical protein